MTENLTFNDLPEAVEMLLKEVRELKRLIIEKQIQPPADEPEQFLTTPQAAKFLHLSVPTIYGKTRRNEIPFMKRGKRILFSKKQLIEYMEKGRNLTYDEIREKAGEFLKK